MSENNVVVRYASDSDAELLAELGAVSFREAFGADNNPADLQSHLESSYSIETILAAINDQTIVYLIAENNGTALGFARLCVAEVPAKITLKNALELQQIYVLKRGWGKGFGLALMEKSIEYARDHQKAGLWLGVWKKNDRAIAFYKKWGFEITGEHTFMVGNDPQQDLLMALAFR